MRWSPIEFCGKRNRPPSTRWECGNPGCSARFPSAVGNLFWEFSTARHFHRVVLGVSRHHLGSHGAKRRDELATAALITSQPAECSRSAGFAPGRQFPRRLPATGPIFLVKAHFFVEARKKSRLEGRGCIFPSFPIVRVMAFFAGVDASAFAVDSPIGQDPFPSFPWSSLRADLPCSSIGWALWTSRSRILSARVGSPICSCQRFTGIWLVRIVERSW